MNLNLLDEWLNSRYEQVLESSDWTGIHARATIETQAAYQSTTDSVMLTVGSTLVTGASTHWGASVAGNKFYRPGDEALYTVAAWTNSTTFTLDRPYEGHGADALGVVYLTAAYVLMQDIYTLPYDTRSVERILDAQYDLPLQQFTAAQLDAFAGNRTMIGNPECFAEIEDTPEVTNQMALHQIELYPPPTFARGLTVEYLRSAYGFDGTNLTASPLPFVSQSVLLYGVRADIAQAAGKLAIAQGYEAQFTQELERLLMVEHGQRRAKPKLQMASRFVRHRLNRAARGYNVGLRNFE